MNPPDEDVTHDRTPPFTEPCDETIDHDQAARSNLETSAVSSGPDALPGPAATQAVPATKLPLAAEGIGPILAGKYTLIERIGEGGMGSVYLARQTEPVKREVALKLIKGGVDSKAVLSRFEAERQALAMMDHPNIARVFDGGTTPSGQPFFVMEVVRGVPITEYCDLHRLSPNARLELFVPVCKAVQHAHQKGIIHRDLKPGNVLVTEVDGRPTPKVIDFGVAKATEQRLTDLSFGDTGAIVGTPTYMSPEQADPSSMDIDTRTDVYALGVMLYELLTGSPPIDAKRFHRGAVLEMLRMVREVDPPRPSTRVSTSGEAPSIAACRAIEPAHLLRWLRGDIDWIVMKALEKDRDRRYDTANGFAADIQRFLADEPVLARPPSRGYRLRKFVKRNKGQVVAASLVLLALVAGIVGTTVGMVEARKQRDIAEREYRRARGAVDDYFANVSENDLLNVPGMQPLRKQLLGSAQKYYQQFVREHAADPSLKDDLAWTHSRLGAVAQTLEQRAEALESFRSAASIYEALAASEPRAWRHRLNQAIAIDRQAMLLIDEAGRADDAEAAILRSQSLFEVLAESRPNDLEIQSLLAGSYGNLAAVAESRGDSKSARTLHKQCLEARRRLLPDHPDDAELLNDLALAEASSARSALYDGRAAEAKQGYRQAITLCERLVEKNPKSAKNRHFLAGMLMDLGRLHFEQGDAETSRGPLERGLVISELLLRENPLVGEYRSGLASAHNMMSDLDRTEGRLKDSGTHAEAARELLEALVREAPGAVGYRESLAKASNVLGRVALAEGRPDEARQAFAHAVELLETVPDPPVNYLYNLACNAALAVPLVNADARAAQVDRAMAALKRAVSAGFSAAEYLRRDSDLDSLREEPAFQQLLRDLPSP